MTTQQVSVFLQNRPGQLLAPLRVLSEAGINLATLSIAEAEEYGILRLIVEDVDGAVAALKAAGCGVKVTEVLALEVPDRPGGLAEVVAALDAAKVNIEYSYACHSHPTGRAVLMIRVDDPGRAEVALAGASAHVLNKKELFS